MLGDFNFIDVDAITNRFIGVRGQNKFCAMMCFDNEGIQRLNPLGCTNSPKHVRGVITGGIHFLDPIHNFPFTPRTILSLFCSLIDPPRMSREGRRSKQRSELKLLGFAQPPALTALGRAAAAATSDEVVARLWCAWLQATPDEALAVVNAKLLAAKRVFARFWRLQPEVRNYFLSRTENPSEEEKRTLQNIELLCNASPVAESFSLADFEALAPLLDNPARRPAFVSEAVSEYRDNKGARSWGPDRRVIAQAWLAATT